MLTLLALSWTAPASASDLWLSHGAHNAGQVTRLYVEGAPPGAALLLWSSSI